MAGTNVGSIYYDLNLDTKKFDKAQENVGNKLGAIGGGLAKFGKVLAGAGVAATVFGGFAVKAFTESENAGAQLNAVLKSTGGIAGVTAEAATNLASSLQKVTTFDDEAILGGENLLLTFTKIGKDVFPQATETMLDMSQALGQDVKSSAVQLGKALQDPIQGVTALRRVGVNFSESQQEMIKKMVEAGDVMGAQKFILAELKTEFGGSARAAAGTLGGQMTRLKNIFGEFMEIVGAGLANAIKPLVQSLLDWIDRMGGLEGVLESVSNLWYTFTTGNFRDSFFGQAEDSNFAEWAYKAHDALEKVKSAISTIGKIAGPFIQNVFNWIVQNKDTFLNIWDLFVAHINSLINVAKIVANIFMQYFWPSLKALFNTIKNQLMPSLGEMWTSLKRIWDALNPGLMIAIKIVAAIIGIALVAAIWLIINAASIFAKILGVVAKAVALAAGWIANLIAWLNNFWAVVVNVILMVVNKFLWLKENWRLVVAKILEFGLKIINWFLALRAKVRETIGNAVSWLWQKGKDIVQGLINGIKNMGNALWRGIAGVSSKIGQFFAGAGSWLFNSGKAIMQGLIDGIRNMAGGVKDAVKSVLDDARNLLPFSPAKEGPFSGKGWTLYSGQSMMQGLAQGIKQMSMLPKQAMSSAMQQTAAVSNNTSNTAIYGNINISDRPTADYFVSKIDRNQQLEGLGLSTRR